MSQFPRNFIDDLRLHADIVSVIGDVVSLKKMGATWKGLCPFHNEKTPSFHVNREKAFFHCFGCNTGGDVIKFVELNEKVAFPEAVRMLAARFGLAIPDDSEARDTGTSAAEREALLKVHEDAAAWFQQQLAGPAGARMRQQLEARGIRKDTSELLGLGCAPSTRDGLKSYLLDRKVELSLLLRSGLVVQRDSGEVVDRFRGRLMIPIYRDSGSVIAFGGRATESDQLPKYLNSPETPIYSKSRTLYGLHLAKPAIRKLGRAILVEGYFDVAQLVQAGITPVVASCGTALTIQQAQLLRRFTSKVVLSFDPDAAGQGAAVRSCELLAAEGFEVNVAVLPQGADPDALVQELGREGYLAQLKQSVPYLEFLVRKAASGHELTSDEGRRRFLHEMLEVASRIPDAAARDQFADRIAARARITEEVVRAEIRKAAVARRTTVPERVLAPSQPLKPAERGLLWVLLHTPDEARLALEELDPEDLEALQSGGALEIARGLSDVPAASFPTAWLERLSEREALWVTGIGAQAEGPAHSADDCVRTLKRLRFDRERTALQREMERLADLSGPDAEARFVELDGQKKELTRRIEALSAD
ncbi:MAG: DNA primase [Vicinamibacteria bacterium]|nr:DNA primase [Vicinamibacteria bacterium]